MWPKFFEWKESYLKYSVLQIFSLILVVRIHSVYNLTLNLNKTLFFKNNLLITCQIFALALLSTSNVVSNRKPETIDELTKLNADKESIALTFTSFLIILTAFIGSCGAYNKSKLILIFVNMIEQLLIQFLINFFSIQFCVLLLLLISIEVLCTYVSLRYNYKVNTL